MFEQLASLSSVQDRLFSLTISCLLGLFIFSSTPSAPLSAAGLNQDLPPATTNNTPIDLDFQTDDITINLQRIDFWDGYLVFVGTVSASSTECITRDDFSLHLGVTVYGAAKRSKTRTEYDMTSPGNGFFSQCISDGKPEILLIPFVVPANGDPALLTFSEHTVTLPRSLRNLKQPARTSLPTPTPTPPRLSPTPTATPELLFIAVTNSSSNLRAGPGTNYDIVKTVDAGAELTIVDTNSAGDWLETADGAWIAAFLVDPINAPVDAGGTIDIPADPPASNAPAGQPAQVINVVDGDTIDVLIDGQEETVRYILIDTPERGEPSADVATAANRALVDGQTVYLVMDQSETDRYGRLLRYVFLADGTFVNAELVRQGMARITPYPPDVSREAELRALQQAAAAAGVGLWRDAGPIAVNNANLRQGPSTENDVIGGVAAGDSLDIFGANSGGDWLQLAGGAWIAASLVNNIPADLPVTATDAFLPGGNPTPVPEEAPAYSGWRVSQNGIEFSSDCACDQGNIYNCGDFGIGMSAQACYLKCREETGRDVHRLDRDRDGNACEWNY